MTLMLRSVGDVLLAYDYKGACWTMPLVFLGWRARKELVRHPIEGDLIPLEAERAVRRVVGLPGEMIPKVPDWCAFTGYRLRRECGVTV